nr:MAG TPA: hypothetical protein [Caudoviricetes sp.]
MALSVWSRICPQSAQIGSPSRLNFCFAIALSPLFFKKSCPLKAQRRSYSLGTVNRWVPLSGLHQAIGALAQPRTFRDLRLSHVLVFPKLLKPFSQYIASLILCQFLWSYYSTFFAQSQVVIVMNLRIVNSHKKQWLNLLTLLSVKIIIYIVERW